MIRRQVEIPELRGTGEESVEAGVDVGVDGRNARNERARGCCDSILRPEAGVAEVVEGEEGRVEDCRRDGRMEVERQVIPRSFTERSRLLRACRIGTYRRGLAWPRFPTLRELVCRRPDALELGLLTAKAGRVGGRSEAFLAALVLPLAAGHASCSRQ